jgi:hypothetical protein
MALRILRDRERPIANALAAASIAVSAQKRPLNVLAIYLESASDLQRVYGEAKKELGAVEVVVLPTPIVLDIARLDKIAAILKPFGLDERQSRVVTARIAKELA